MGDVHLREALLDRLNLLENRIHQLSQELDDGGRSSGGDRNATAAVTCPAEKQRQMPYNSSRRESGSPFRSGSSNYQSQVSQKKVAEPTQAATTEAMDKKAAAFPPTKTGGWIVATSTKDGFLLAADGLWPQLESASSFVFSFEIN